MRLILFLIVGFLFSANANSYSQSTRLNVKLKNSSVSELMKFVEDNSEFVFLYKTEDLDMRRKVTLDLEDASIQQVLDAAFGDQNIGWDVYDRQIVLRKENISTVREQAQQQRTVTGSVTDSRGLPLPGVTVVVKGTTTGTVTGEDGNFTLQVPADAETLSFSFVGMHMQDIAIEGRTTFTVVMEEESIGLEEVVAVGYGVQKKATVTGSIASTDDEAIKRAPVTSLSNSLSGLLPGLTTLNRSGEPGQNVSEIYIRGRSTTGDTSPLVVVDGVPDETGAWQRINQNDIEQISILKDASSSIYGARAANGVILITTKRGSISKPIFNYTFNQGIVQPTRLPEMANSWEFAEYVNQYRETMQNLPPLYTSEEIQIMRDGSDPLNYPNADWVGSIFKDYSTQSMHNLNIRGGTENARYSMSGSYSHENSIVENGLHEFKVYTLRSNLDFDITDNIIFGLDLNGELNDRIRPVMGDFGTQGSPLIAPFFPNGLPTSLPGDAGENPAINLTGEGGYYSDKVYRTGLKPSFNINIPAIEGLGMEGYFSYRQDYTESRRWRDTWTVYNYDRQNNEYIEKTGGQIAKPDLQDIIEKRKDYLAHFRIKFENTFGDHSIQSFIAVEQAEGEFRSITAYRKDFVSSSIQELFAGSGENMVANGTRREWGRQNLFGRFHYNYQGKYLIETNLRYDGSYAFPKEKRWGFFPGVSVGWRLSQEGFMKNSELINDLKIRASYGEMGNDQIDAFQFLSMYNLNPIGTHFGQGTQAILIPGVAPNQDITWEVAKNSNLGLDATLGDGRFSITADVFKQKRSNILTARTTEVPIYTGLVLPDENIGIIENKGFELSLTHRNLATSPDQFSYSVMGNIGYAKNKIIDISEPQDMLDYQKAEGSVIGAQLLYKAIGIFRTQEEVESNPIMAGTQVGDLQYEDIDKNGVINSLDRIREDRGIIPELTFGFNTTFAFKNFSVFANFTGQARAWTYFHKHARTTQNSLRDLIINRYTPGSMDSKYPILPQEDGAGEGEVSGMPSTFWLQDASFLRLKTLQLDYTLPSSFVSKLGLNSLMLFINGNNLFTISDIEWYDPEGTPESSSHDDFRYSTGSFYPQTKIYNIGVNITF